LVLLSLAFIVYIIFTVRPSEVLLVTHYTAYGVTNLYLDQWFYLLSFIGLAVFVAFFHVALAIKVYVTKGHPLAAAVIWAGIGIIGFACVTAASIISVWSPI